MGVRLYERSGGRIYIIIREHGRARWIATGLTRSSDRIQDREVLRLAEAMRSREEQRIAAGQWGLVDPGEAKRPLVEYAEALAERQRPKNHLPKSLRYLRAHFGELQIGAVDERALEAYRDYLLAQPALGQTTASHYFAALRTVLHRAERDRVISRDPCKRVDGIKIPEAVKVYLTPEELGRLASRPLGGQLGAEISRGFLFGCLTGLRVSDVCSLRWGDVQRGEAPAILKRQRKTQTVVGIPLAPSAWALIDDGAIHRHDELVFPALTASKTQHNQYLAAWAARVGIDKRVGWHTARHTFAVLSLDGGADLYTVSRLLGHKSIATTQVYAKATDRMKRAAVEALPAIRLELKQRKGKI